MFSVLAGFLLGIWGLVVSGLAGSGLIKQSSQEALLHYSLPAVNRIAQVHRQILGVKDYTTRPTIIVSKPVRRVNESEFNLSATSGLAWDVNNRLNLFAKDADRQLPIASISKLMAALVFIDHSPGWNTTYTIQAGDERNGTKPNFYEGETILIRDLFYSALVASDNSAIISLVNASGLSEGKFVDAMNAKAWALAMDQTHFVEPTGLSDLNVSTARDVAKLAATALSDLDIRRAVLTDKYELVVTSGKKKTKRIIKNTDQLLGNKKLDVEIVGGKTGYLTSAGYCFVGDFTKDGQEIITVVLGAGDHEARFSETARLLDWVFETYQWEK